MNIDNHVDGTTERPISFKQDIPSQEWVATKVQYAEEDGRNAFGVPRTFGPITGSFSDTLLLPVALLATIPGERGEQQNVRPESLKAIRDDWERIKQEPVFVEIDPFGKAWLSEGNHRIMVAQGKGEAAFAAEVRYFSGGQLKTDEMRPENLLKMDLTQREHLRNTRDAIVPATGAEIATDGRFVGKVKDVNEQFVTLDAGRGRLVKMSTDGFDTLPIRDHIMDVQLRSGKAKVVEPQSHGKGKER